MINSEKIASYISNPQILAFGDIANLDEIISKFPYCSTLHLLKLKAASSSNSLNFEAELRYGAIHVSDREKMYYLLHSEEEKGQSEKEGKEQRAELLGNSDISTSLDVQKEKEGALRLSEKQKENEEALRLSEKQKENEEAIRLSEKLKESEKVLGNKEKAIGNREKGTGQIEEKEKRQSDISTSLDGEQDKEQRAKELGQSETEKQKENEGEEKVEKLREEKEKLHAQTKAEIDKAILPNLIETALGNELLSESVKKIKLEKVEIKPEVKLEKKVITAKKIEAVDLSKLSFVEWLKYKQNAKVNAGKESAVKEVENEKQASSFQKPKATKSHIDDLLNKFITEEPSISRPKTEFFNPVKNAKKSLEESPDLVTETLAKIYLLQKNYTKAINAYEQLILVYPEKKTFFASQIEKIKEEQHK